MSNKKEPEIFLECLTGATRLKPVREKRGLQGAGGLKPDTAPSQSDTGKTGDDTNSDKTHEDDD